MNEKQTRLGFSVGVFEGFRVRVVWILGMNRSFRAQESQMHAASKQREQQFGGLRTSVMKEKEEELRGFSRHFGQRMIWWKIRIFRMIWAEDEFGQEDFSYFES